MVKKIRRMRTFARTASKSMEKNLIDAAQKIYDDPYIVIPDYNDSYSDKYFSKLKKSISKVERFKDDEKKLEKFANKKTLEGAVAGTFQLVHSKKAPYLAVLKFITGDVTYAQRGRADKEQLIAVQHFDNPTLRLLGIKDLAIKKGINVYSWDNGFFSSGKDFAPPKEFVDFIIKKVGFKIIDDVVVCGDLKPSDVKSKKPVGYYLCIHWKSANIFFAICENCSKNSKNIMFKISQYLINKNLSEDFDICVVGTPYKKEDNEENVETIEIDSYLSGGISDYDFIIKNKKNREGLLKDRGELIFILDGKNYGTDKNAFIDDLKPKKHEKTGLEYMLDKLQEPLVVKDVSANKVLEMFWKKYGKETISSIVDDEELSEKFFSLKDTPSEILETVLKYVEKQEILSQYPKYTNLPPLAKYIDKIVKTYKTFGIKETLIEIKNRPDTPKGKSVAYAFLLAMGKGEDKKWKYSQVEIEYGEFLKEYVKKILDSDPKNYEKNLQELLTVSGSSEKIK